MADFDALFMWVLRLEDSTLSGVVKDLGDGAGLTRLGLTQKDDGGMLPTSFFDKNIPVAVAIDLAKPVYRTKYWNPMKGDQITDNVAAASIFSFCVNGGEGNEIHIMQAAFGLDPDGQVGPMTLAAWNRPDAAAQIRQAQIAHYKDLYRKNPERDGKWIDGWLRRANLVYPALL